MAISTAKTFLMYESVAGTFTKLVDIINYPDMGSTPDKIDTTDLSAEKMRTIINGLQDAPDLTFEANYDETAYETIVALTGTKKFQLHFGTAGASGIFEWSGEVSIYVTGGGVNESRKMQITTSASTEIVKK